MLVGLVSSQPALAQNPPQQALLVVVNPAANINELSEKHVTALFLGRAKFLPGGSGRVKAIDYPVDSDVRAAFYQALTGRNIADIDAYWARLTYSGSASPPQALSNSEQILQMVAQQESAIAYLPGEYQEQVAARGLQTVLTVEIN